MKTNVCLTLEQHGFETIGSTSLQIPLYVYFFAKNTCTVSICSWEFADAESRLYASIYALLCGFWCLCMFGGVVGPGTSPHRY